KAGIPAGVLNVVHGGADVVNQLIESDAMKAVSFIGELIRILLCFR
ncbi:MAG: aldehyde dehydrogenase family protein, partial [Acinetobacter sp.]|nr:aldehyde dehydrogenase family protein [Acinetobacter sp.]